MDDSCLLQSLYSHKVAETISYGKLDYLYSTNLSKSFSQLIVSIFFQQIPQPIVSIFFFSRYFFSGYESYKKLFSIENFFKRSVEPVKMYKIFFQSTLNRQSSRNVDKNFFVEISKISLKQVLLFFELCKFPPEIQRKLFLEKIADPLQLKI